MQIWTDHGRITLKLDELDDIELVFDVFPDGFAIGAWCDSETGKVIEFVKVGEA